jgi:hypothetical protein
MRYIEDRVHVGDDGMSYEQRVQILADLGRQIEQRLADIDKRLAAMESNRADRADRASRIVALAICGFPLIWFLIGVLLRPLAASLR